jgi:hypothetical protein
VAQPIAAPLPAGFCSVHIDGKGPYATEPVYLPHVIT